MIKRLLFISGILAMILYFCTDYYPIPKIAESECVSFDLDSISKRGRLIAVTDFNSINYFIYKGESMGFHYELLKSFADQIGIDVEIIAENDPEKAYAMLKSGEADIIAIESDTTVAGEGNVRFSQPLDESRLVLVQRKPGSRAEPGIDRTDRLLVRSTADLAGLPVYVQKGSPDKERLLAIEREIGDSIRIIEVPYDPEQLIRNVANGEIDYTICNENIALVNATYYPGIDVNTSLSPARPLSWSVRDRDSDSLIYELNRWISAYRKTGSYALLYNKYFKNPRSGIIVRSDYYASGTGRISPYDDMIRKFSEGIKWDWRLLASLIFQESGFNPDVTSKAGAYGLMQIMPITGWNFGIDITSSPENNLKAGILYIKWLYSIFDSRIFDEKERLNFILASYNAGPGHILDAMKLAEKNGMDAQKWNGNVALWLTKKSEPQYYNDTVVKNGYFRGIESVNFVSSVLDRFEQYKNIIPPGKVAPF